MIYIGSDHGGYDLKNKIKEYLKQGGNKVVDIGVFQIKEPADYPDIAHEVAEKVRENEDSCGILVCGTGVGMCMAANKVKGIRAAVCESEQTVEMSRKHNDSNMLCLGGRILQDDKALRMVDIFLNTEFEKEERHIRRVGKIEPQQNT